jgi:hypothetical protein
VQCAHHGPVLLQRSSGLVDLRFIRGDEKVVAAFARQIEKPMPVEAPVATANCLAALAIPLFLRLVQGVIITLMQPSCLLRNVLYISGPFSSGTLCVMTNDGSILPSSISCSSFGR